MFKDKIDIEGEAEGKGIQFDIHEKVYRVENNTMVTPLHGTVYIHQDFQVERGEVWLRAIDDGT